MIADKPYMFLNIRKPKYTYEKVNGEYVFTSTRKNNRTLGSSASDDFKIARKVRNKIQKTSRRLNR